MVIYGTLKVPARSTKTERQNDTVSAMFEHINKLEQRFINSPCHSPILSYGMPFWYLLIQP